MRKVLKAWKYMPYKYYIFKRSLKIKRYASVLFILTVHDYLVPHNTARWFGSKAVLALVPNYLAVYEYIKIFEL